MNKLEKYLVTEAFVAQIRLLIRLDKIRLNRLKFNLVEKDLRSWLTS